MAKPSRGQKREQCATSPLARATGADQIARVLSQLPPYSLTPPRFRFRALATLAGRAPLGGAREVALATYLVARLVDDASPGHALPEGTRSARATAARGWLAAMALPSAVRPALMRLVDASGDDGPALHGALRNVITVTANYLDPAAVSDLEKLAQALV